MADVVYVISYADVPSRRVVYGKRTQSHVYYRAFETQAEMTAAIKAIREAEQAYNASKSAEWASKGFGKWIQGPATRYSYGPRPAALWPLWDGSRKNKGGGWQSYDNVKAMWRKQQQARIAEIAARRATA